MGVTARVVPDGVDVRLFKPSRPESRPLRRPAGEQLVVLFVGSLVDVKRPEVAFELARSLPRVRFVVKAGVISKRYVPLLREVPPNVTLVRRILTHAQMARLYGACDVLLCPSIHEGLANVLLEAAASGLPLVAWRATSHGEFVRDGVNGYLCSSVKQAQERLATLARDPDERRRLGASARRAALARSWERVVPAWASVYDSLR
ncbi:MAG: hypothetical protein Kow0069_08550 [Promethearchaeota archaeon]